MLKIRMQRVGRKNEPQFRIVVGEHTMGPKSGRFLEKLGSYDPKTKKHTLDTERAKHWMDKGAQLSDTLHNLFINIGVIKGDKINVLPKKTAPEKEAPAAEEVKEEAPVAEAPAGTEEKKDEPAA